MLALWVLLATFALSFVVTAMLAPRPPGMPRPWWERVNWIDFLWHDRINLACIIFSLYTIWELLR